MRIRLGLLGLAALGLLTGLLVTVLSLLQVLTALSQPSVVIEELGGSPESIVTTSPIRFLWRTFELPVNQGPAAALFAHPFAVPGLAASLLCAIALMALFVRLVRSQGPLDKGAAGRAGVDA